MTIALPVHRALTTKLAGRSFNAVTRFGYNPWLARVNHNSSEQHDLKPSLFSPRSSGICSIATRSYATSTTAKPVGRPKAHTGRTPAKRTTKAATAKKPGPKTAAGKKAVGRKPKAKTVAKPKSKPKPKPRSNAKAKAKPNPKVKKAPSKTALAKERVSQERELKEKALLNTPKGLPQNPWNILFTEAQVGKHDFADSQNRTKEAAQRFKNLTPEEKEHYNHLAHTNKEQNDAEFKKWLSQYTPQQIREANNARRALKRIHAKKHPDLKQQSSKFAPLSDDRLVKRPVTAYVQFSRDRHASGDFLKMSVAESSRLIGREWKALEAADKKKFEDIAKADINRYKEEAQTVYGGA